MGTYNRIAGQSIERLAALSDGVFAVAMTLLVLDLHTPAAELVHGERDLVTALWALAPRLLVYMMSFLTLGIFWVGQQTQLNMFARTDRDLSWIHLGFLFFVSLMPFSTALMAAFVAFWVALVVYWLNILLLGAALFASWSYAAGYGLVEDEVVRTRGPGVRRRILVAQALYAAGACLCVFNTYWSLGFIVLVQLNFVLAPRIGVLGRV